MAGGGNKLANLPCKLIDAPMLNDRVHKNLISLHIHFLIHTGKTCCPRTNTKTPRLIAIMYIVSNTVKYYTIQLFPCSGIKSKEGKQKINNQKLAYIELELIIVTTSALGKRQSYSRIQ